MRKDAERDAGAYLFRDEKKADLDDKFVGGALRQKALEQKKESAARPAALEVAPYARVESISELLGHQFINPSKGQAGRLFGHLTQASDENGVGGGERFRLFRNYPLQFSVLRSEWISYCSNAQLSSLGNDTATGHSKFGTFRQIRAGNSQSFRHFAEVGASPRCGFHGAHPLFRWRIMVSGDCRIKFQ